MRVEVPIYAPVWFDMLEYAAWANSIQGSEVGGYAHYDPEDGIYKLAPLCDQECHGAETYINPARILNDTKYDMSDMKVWWHSHVFMGTSPSSTDRDTIKSWGAEMDVSIRLIINLKMEYTCHAYAKDGFDTHEYDVTLIPYFDRKKFGTEIRRYVRKPKPVIVAKVPEKKKDDKKDDKKPDKEAETNGNIYPLTGIGDEDLFHDTEKWRALQLQIVAIDDRVKKLIRYSAKEFEYIIDRDSCQITHRKTHHSLYYNQYGIWVNGQMSDGEDWFKMIAKK